MFHGNFSIHTKSFQKVFLFCAESIFPEGRRGKFIKSPFGEIKEAFLRNVHKGCFLLTGSDRYLSMEDDWAGWG